MSALLSKPWGGKMFKLKMYGVVLDAVLILLIAITILSFFYVANNIAEDNIPEHIQE